MSYNLVPGMKSKAVGSINRNQPNNSLSYLDLHNCEHQLRQRQRQRQRRQQQLDPVYTRFIRISVVVVIVGANFLF